MREDRQKECWYVVICKPRQEATAEDNLRRQSFNVYLPRTKVRHYRKGLWFETVEVLFPRYCFIGLDPCRQSIAPVRSTRGVAGLVRFGGRPAKVPDDVMEFLRRGEDPATGMHLVGRTEFRAGEAIRLVGGPISGIEGIFAQEDGQTRVTVLLDMLGKTNKISVSRDWVSRAA